MVQRYAPELSKRCRRELRRTNGSWRVDESYLRVAGKWTYLYRGVDSAGNTIDFFLSPNRDAHAAKQFLQKALRVPGHPRPRVINVDGNPSYPKVISELQQTAELGRRCRCHPVPYLINILEQDHRSIKRRVRASQGFRFFDGALRTIQGIETVRMIRKVKSGGCPRVRLPNNFSSYRRFSRFKLPHSIALVFQVCNQWVGGRPVLGYDIAKAGGKLLMK